MDVLPLMELKMKRLILLVLIFQMPMFIFSQGNRNLKLVDSTQVEMLSLKFMNILYKTDTSFSTVNYRFDDHARLFSLNRSVENSETQSSVRYFYNENNLVVKKIQVDSDNLYINLPDTLITRISYDDFGNISNEVVTNSKDSLLWIKNFIYNERREIIKRVYFETPPSVLKHMPEYEKDSISYDYKNNIKYDYTLDNNGEYLMIFSSPIIVEKDDAIRDHQGILLENDKVRRSIKYDEAGNWIYIEDYRKSAEGETLKGTITRAIKYRTN